MMYQTGSLGPEAARLEDYLRAVQRHKWMVLGLTLLVALAAAGYGMSRPASYTSTATVLLRPTPGPNNQMVAPNLEREREVLASNHTAEQVRADLQLAAPAPELLQQLMVEFRPDSDVLRVSFTDHDKAGAAAGANAFATSYVNQREAAARGFYDSTIASANAEHDRLVAVVGTIQSQIDATQQDRTKQAAAPGSAPQVATLDAQLNSLRGDLTTVYTNIRTLDTQASQAKQALAARSPAAEVLRSAVAPGHPDGLDLRLLVLGGVLAGLLLGVVAAFLAERLDTTAREAEDVALALGATVMGSVPKLGVRHRSGPSSLVMLSRSGSTRIGTAREAFRRLRTSVEFLNSSSGISTLLVTSAQPSEGKSLTSANLAIALAQNGSRCVLVSADLRRPSLEALFGMEDARPGLSEYLASASELNAERVAGIDNLWLIRSGATADNPGELLSSGRFELMLKELDREEVQYVVIDTPPLLSAADALSAARHVDGVIVVVDSERTATTELLQARADLERTGSRLLGAVMNRQKVPRAGLLRGDRYTYHR